MRRKSKERPKTESAKYGQIEVRAQDGELDEIVGVGTLHLEQMSDGLWWLSFTDKDGHMIHCNLWGTGKCYRDRDCIDHEVVGRAEYQGVVERPKPRKSNTKGTT